MLKENRRNVAVIVVLSLATGGLSSALIAMTAPGVNTVGSDHFGWLAVAFAVLCALTLAGRHGHRYAVTVVSNRLELALRSRLSALVAGALAHGYVVIDSMPLFRSLRERQARLMRLMRIWPSASRSSRWMRRPRGDCSRARSPR